MFDSIGEQSALNRSTCINNTKRMHFDGLIVCAATVFAYASSLCVGLLTLLYDIFVGVWDRLKHLKSIRGEIAVVTGGAGGLGSAICLELAKQGCHIAVVDVNSIGAQAVADRLARDHANIKVRAYGVDITQREAVMVLRADIERDFQKAPTILINNAGMVIFKEILKPEPEEVQRMIDVNLTAHFWMIEAFLPVMKAQKSGHIVAISSVAGQLTFPYFPVYTSTKFGIRGLMRCLRVSLKLDGLYEQIRTTIIYPFAMETNQRALKMFEDSGGSNLLPAIKSQTAARHVVLAMQRNKDEVTFYGFFELIYRIVEMMPVPLADWMILLFSRSTLKNIKGDCSPQPQTSNAFDA